MVRIKRYAPSEYTRELIETLQPLREAIHAEKSPDEPPPTTESLERQLQGIPPHQRVETWIATLSDGTVVGRAVLVLFETAKKKGARKRVTYGLGSTARMWLAGGGVKGGTVYGETEWRTTA